VQIVDIFPQLTDLCRFMLLYGYSPTEFSLWAYYKTIWTDIFGCVFQASKKSIPDLGSASRFDIPPEISIHFLAI